MQRTIRFHSSVVTFLLSLVQAGVANEPVEMPNWPIGGSVRATPQQHIVAPPLTTAAAIESQAAVKSPTAPPPPARVDEGTVVHATQRETLPAPAQPDHRHLAPSPDRLLGRSLQNDNSAGTPRSIPKFGLPTGTIYTTATALAIVVGLFLLCTWLLRRGGRRATAMLPTEAVSVVGRVQLTARQNAELLRVGNKLVLVALTPGGAEPLTEITDPAEVNHLLGLCRQLDKHSTTKEFEDVFRELSQEPAPSNLFGQESLLAASAPVVDAYLAHRREVGRA